MSDSPINKSVLAKKFEQLRGFTDEYKGMFGSEAISVNNMSGQGGIGIEVRSLDEPDEENTNVMILPKAQAIKLALFILQEYEKLHE